VYIYIYISEGIRVIPHNEAIHEFFSASNIIRRTRIKEDEIGGKVACMACKTNAQRFQVKKPEHNRPLGRPRCR
jgi:hypothetical protein